MTIICAQKTRTGVVFGADNGTSDGSRFIRRATPKLQRISPRIAFGSSGHTRIADRLRDIKERGEFPDPVPVVPACEKDIAEVEHELGRFFRFFLKDEFFGAKEGKLWTIVAVDDHIFDVGPDGACVRVDGRFIASGNTELIAMGALYVLNMECEGLPTEEQGMVWLRIAMEACAEYGELIRPPWSFVSTTKPL